MKVLQTLGKLPSGKRLDRILQSPHYKNGSFQNIKPTAVIPDKVPFLKIMRDFSKKSKTVSPANTIPFIQSDLLQINGEKPAVTWFGHSSYLIRLAGLTILVDPVFSAHASPFSFFGRPFAGTNNYGADDFPPIDLLLLTHDHYDHLDFETIKALSHKVSLFVAPLGLGAHLEHWGVTSERIVELDWWESFDGPAGLRFHATPARHFSGRGLTRAKSLCTSYVLQSSQCNLCIGGDSGYDATFQLIGDKFGPFDISFLECGQYGKTGRRSTCFQRKPFRRQRISRQKFLSPYTGQNLSFQPTHGTNPSPDWRLLPNNKARNLWHRSLVKPYLIGEPYEQKLWWKWDI